VTFQPPAGARASTPNNFVNFEIPEFGETI
jgi:hypothetical protein